MEFDFEKNSTVDDIAVVPEEYRGVYVKGEDGKYAIGDAYKAVVGAVVGFSKTVKNVRKENDTLRRGQVDLAPWKGLGAVLNVDGDVTPEALKTAAESLIEKAKNGGEFKTNLAKMKEDMERAQATALAAKDTELTAMQTTLTKHMVTSAAVQAIAEEKGTPALLLPLISERARVVKDSDGAYVVRVFDDAGEARGDGKGGFMTVAQLVKEMKGSKELDRKSVV